MKFVKFTLLVAILHSQVCYGQTEATKTDTAAKSTQKIIFAYGGQLDKVFLRYIITLTKKEKSKICFLPTASGDNPDYISFWQSLCKKVSVEPYVLKTFSVSSNTQTFEEQLLSMDAIVIGAGNTINMLAVWRAQGIDTILRKAYEKGIIMAGGSAGSLCWFANGITGSRPQQLTIIEGLGFLNFSNCPHYHSQPMRRPVYQKNILDLKILSGYACDDLAGVLFINGVFKKSVSQNKLNNNYYISANGGIIKEQKLESELIK
jgi:dipeptidase E